MKLGSIYIYDPEAKEKSKAWRHSDSLVQRSSRHRSHQAMFDVCFLGKEGIWLVDFMGKGARGAKYYVAPLEETEAVTGVQTPRQAFKVELVSLRQCCSSQGGHYVQIFTLNF
jgi:hypothetical protein